MGRVLSQTTLEQLKKAKVRHFCKFLLNLKTGNYEGISSVLCKGSYHILGRRSIRSVVWEIVDSGYNLETRKESAYKKNQEENILKITMEIFSTNCTSGKSEGMN